MTNSSASLPPITAITPPPSAATAVHALSSFGLGYSIAIALGFLVLLSTLLLSSYLCCRHHRHHHPSAAARTSSGIILPRVFFVSEDDDDEENLNNNSGVVGLHQSAINSYPKYSFSKSGAGKDDLNSAICSICLSDYTDGEMLRMMPDCKHFFHLLCLDAWLRLNGSCPVCRSSPLPTPLSTPLSEVVPLAQYADDRRRRSVMEVSSGPTCGSVMAKTGGRPDLLVLLLGNGGVPEALGLEIGSLAFLAAANAMDSIFSFSDSLRRKSTHKSAKDWENKVESKLQDDYLRIYLHDRQKSSQMVFQKNRHHSRYRQQGGQVSLERRGLHLFHHLAEQHLFVVCLRLRIPASEPLDQEPAILHITKKGFVGEV
ncbi:hypothetical protein V2J09_002388 [Rumex salicifolius]